MMSFPDLCKMVVVFKFLVFGLYDVQSYNVTSFPHLGEMGVVFEFLSLGLCDAK
jgi:hypothetical protein